MPNGNPFSSSKEKENGNLFSSSKEKEK